MAITPGGRVGDASPLGTHGPRRLDDYVREVAHALMRKGYSKSHAIAVAKNSLKRWRRGGGHVRPQVRAGAAAHLGIQEGLDKSRSFNMANSLASSQDGPRGTVASVVSPAFGGKKAAPFKKGGGKAKLRPGSIPAGKGKGKFPITDQKSVKSAASLLSKAKGVSKQAVVAHVRAEAKRRGLKLTPAFKPKQTDSSNVFDLVGPKGYSHGWVRAGGPLPRGKRGGKSRAAVGLVPSGARTKTRAVPPPTKTAKVRSLPPNDRVSGIHSEKHMGERVTVRRHPTKQGYLEASINGHPISTPIGRTNADAVKHLDATRGTVEHAKANPSNYTNGNGDASYGMKLGPSVPEARKKVADALRNSPTTPDNPTAYVGRASTAQLQALLSDKRYASWRGLVQAELDKRKKA